MPAKRVMWLRPTPDSVDDPTAANATFDGKVCDTVKLTEVVVGGVQIGCSMVSDHFHDNYERALNAMAAASAPAKIKGA